MLKLNSAHSVEPSSRTFSVNRETISLIQHALQGLRYGQISLTIHDGRLIQLDRVQRSRLEQPQPTH